MDQDPDQDQSSLTSIENIQARELYPKKLTCFDDPSLSVTFPLLHGEYVSFLGNTSDGVIALSNYRLFIHVKETFFNIPIGLIEQVECREIFYLYVYCKDARSVRCTFATNETCLEWYKRLTAAKAPPTKLEDLYAFAFYAWCMEENRFDLHRALTLDYSVETNCFNVLSEANRMGINFTAWRISRINRDHKLCPTYPKDFIVPASVEDEDLQKVANFRSSRRIPVVVWRHQKNGCVLARCSQPEVGWFGRRDSYDEEYVSAIAKACAIDVGIHESSLKAGADASNVDSCALSYEPKETEANNPKMLIMDARSYAAAVANRAKGGGCECHEYYPDCEIQFMCLPNIHSIRKSFQSVRQLCASTADQTDWFSMLECTKWLANISGLLKSALVAVNAIDRNCQPVLVHCSDGWDRTPQIVALAELMLDPYYRTFEGFQVLVEREWLDFGHKFGDRCGHGLQAEDPNERCPVFLQWLDCVHQLLRQFPCSFEFNEAYLMKLVQHTYSCLFGTFLCNNSQERQTLHVADRTYSVWAFFKVKRERFYNHLYINKEQVLRPSCHVRDLSFWSLVYLSSHATTDEVAQTSVVDTVSVECTSKSDKEHQSGVFGQLSKTRSCDNLLTTVEHYLTGSRQRRASDPSLLDGGKRDFSSRGSDEEEEEEAAHSPVKTPSSSSPDLVVGSGKLNLSGNIPCPPVMNCSRPLPLEDDDSGNEDDRVEPLPQEATGSCPVVENKSKMCNNNEASTFDSSTDTLVGDLMGQGEVPIVHSAGRCKNYNLVSNEVGKSDLATPMTNGCRTKEEFINCKCNVLTPRYAQNSVSTSTSDISDSHVSSLNVLSNNLKPGVNGHNHSSSWSKILSSCRCNFMVNGKKLALNEHTAGALNLDAGVTPVFKPSASSSCRNSVDSTPLHSRTPSSGFPATPNDERTMESVVTKGPSYVNSTVSSLARKLDIDGLTLLTDEVQQRLHQIDMAKMSMIKSLKRELEATQLILCNHVYQKCNGAPQNFESADEMVSLPDSVGSAEHLSLGQETNSDVSWEQVDEHDGHPTLWVPDHAVTRCTGCEIEFWLGCRRHHCRNCGKIFCSTCSNQMIPIPNEQLYHPVRVCFCCFDKLRGQRCCSAAMCADQKMNKNECVVGNATAAASN